MREQGLLIFCLGAALVANLQLVTALKIAEDAAESTSEATQTQEASNSSKYLYSHEEDDPPGGEKLEGAATYDEYDYYTLPEDSGKPNTVKREGKTEDTFYKEDYSDLPSGEEYEVYQGVRGRPGIDFPVYSRIPHTAFSCRKVKTPGYYADLETHCQVFHICDGGRKMSFLCPNGTVFRQSHLICDWWFRVDCGESEEFYEASAEQLHQDRRKHYLKAFASLEDLSDITVSTETPTGQPTEATEDLRTKAPQGRRVEDRKRNSGGKASGKEQSNSQRIFTVPNGHSGEKDSPGESKKPIVLETRDAKESEEQQLPAETTSFAKSQFISGLNATDPKVATGRNDSSLEPVEMTTITPSGRKLKMVIYKHRISSDDDVLRLSGAANTTKNPEMGNESKDSHSNSTATTAPLETAGKSNAGKNSGLDQRSLSSQSVKILVTNQRNGSTSDGAAASRNSAESKTAVKKEQPTRKNTPTLFESAPDRQSGELSSQATVAGRHRIQDTLGNQYETVQPVDMNGLLVDNPFNSRAGLNIPVSAGPAALHSLALYFANSDEEVLRNAEPAISTTPAYKPFYPIHPDFNVPDRSVESNRPNPAFPQPSSEKPNPGEHFISSQISGSTLKRLNLQEDYGNESDYRDSNESDENNDLLLQQSGPVTPPQQNQIPGVLIDITVPTSAGVFEGNRSEELLRLAQVFSRALSAYLRNPDKFRKSLTSVRPTAPSSDEVEETKPSTSKEEFDEDPENIHTLLEPGHSPFSEPVNQNHDKTHEPFDEHNRKKDSFHRNKTSQAKPHYNRSRPSKPDRHKDLKDPMQSSDEVLDYSDVDPTPEKEKTTQPFASTESTYNPYYESTTSQALDNYDTEGPSYTQTPNPYAENLSTQPQNKNIHPQHSENLQFLDSTESPSDYNSLPTTENPDIPSPSSIRDLPFKNSFAVAVQVNKAFSAPLNETYPEYSEYQYEESSTIPPSTTTYTAPTTTNGLPKYGGFQNNSATTTRAPSTQFEKQKYSTQPYRPHYTFNEPSTPQRFDPNQNNAYTSTTDAYYRDTTTVTPETSKYETEKSSGDAYYTTHEPLHLFFITEPPKRFPQPKPSVAALVNPATPEEINYHLSSPETSSPSTLPAFTPANKRPGNTRPVPPNRYYSAPLRSTTSPPSTETTTLPYYEFISTTTEQATTYPPQYTPSTASRKPTKSPYSTPASQSPGFHRPQKRPTVSEPPKNRPRPHSIPPRRPSPSLEPPRSTTDRSTTAQPVHQSSSPHVPHKPQKIKSPTTPARRPVYVPDTTTVPTTYKPPTPYKTQAPSKPSANKQKYSYQDATTFPTTMVTEQTTYSPETTTTSRPRLVLLLVNDRRTNKKTRDQARAQLLQALLSAASRNELQIAKSPEHITRNWPLPSSKPYARIENSSDMVKDSPIGTTTSNPLATSTDEYTEQTTFSSEEDNYQRQTANRRSDEYARATQEPEVRSFDLLRSLYSLAARWG